MRDASGDSLLALEAEYKRILDSINAATYQPVQTGGPDLRSQRNDSIVRGTDSTVAALHEGEDSARSETTSPLAEGNMPAPSDTTRPAAPDTVATGQTGPSNGIEVFEGFPASSNDSRYDDPSKIFKGLRKSELQNAPGYSRSAPQGGRIRTAPARRRTPQQFAASRNLRRSAGFAGRRREQLAEASRSAGRSGLSEKMAGRKLVNGMAAAQAGRYKEAVQQLAPAVRSRTGARETGAGYSYAVALEKSGQLSRAADEYLRLSRTGGEVGQKSYVSYCRLLAKLGQRDRAKRLVLQFIQRNPDSTQVVTARRLLQTL
jgi:hypothetical protein